MVVKKIGVASAGKMLGALYAVIGLIIGVIFALLSLLGAGMEAALGESGDAGFFGAIFGLGAIVIFPVIYGVMGFIGGLIMAVVYNLVASFAGGIRLEVE